MKPVYIHRGHSCFDIGQFEQISNWDSPKPVIGGLWASRQDSPNAWTMNTCYQRPNDYLYFKFILKETARILEINTPSDLEGLPRYIPDGTSANWPVVLDFEGLSLSYDVICCNAPYGSELDKILPKWECECILVMNPDVIEIIDE